MIKPGHAIRHPRDAYKELLSDDTVTIEAC
jgi:hypothetical protein